MTSSSFRASLASDFERFKRALPRDFAAHVRDAYRINLAGRYLGEPLPHPVGKGSGQASPDLSMLDGGGGCGVIKTVTPKGPGGARSMSAWPIHESKIKVEPRDGGWTVTWKGRGWDRSFDEYLALVRAAWDVTAAGQRV